MMKSITNRLITRILVILITGVSVVGFAAAERRDLRKLSTEEKEFEKEWSPLWLKSKKFFVTFRESIQKVDDLFKLDLSKKTLPELRDFQDDLFRDFSLYQHARVNLSNQWNIFQRQGSLKNNRPSLGSRKVAKMVALFGHPFHLSIQQQYKEKIAEINNKKNIILERQARERFEAFLAPLRRMKDSTAFLAKMTELRENYLNSLREHPLGVEYLGARYMALQNLAQLDELCSDLAQLERDNSSHWMGCNLTYSAIKDAPREMKSLSEMFLKVYLKVLRQKRPDKKVDLDKIQELKEQGEVILALKKYDELLEQLL